MRSEVMVEEHGETDTTYTRDWPGGMKHSWITRQEGWTGLINTEGFRGGLK
jgi:hypothetical protein